MVPSDAKELHVWPEYVSGQCQIKGSGLEGGATNLRSHNDVMLAGWMN